MQPTLRAIKLYNSSQLAVGGSLTLMVALTMGELISAFPMSKCNATTPSCLLRRSASNTLCCFSAGGGMYWCGMKQRACMAFAGLKPAQPSQWQLHIFALLQVDCNPGCAEQGPRAGALPQLACM